MNRRLHLHFVLILSVLLVGTCASVGTATAASLDPSFSGDGVATSDPTALDEDLNDAVLDAQGRELVVFSGFAKEGPTRAFVARYLPSGDLDPTFGTGGLAEIPWTKETESPNGVVLDAQGRIVVGGDAVEGAARGFDFAAARYLPDGTLDPTFGTGGVVSLDIPGAGFDLGNDVAVDAAGRVLVAGVAIKIGKPGEKSTSSMTVVRWTEGGTLDPSFGEKGVAKVNVGGAPQASAATLAVDGAGRIDVGGLFGAEGTATPLVARLTDEGKVDPGFGNAGLAPLSFGAGTTGSVGDLVLDGERIVTSGNFKDIAGDEGFAVSRLLGNGAADPTLGTAGTVATSRPGLDVLSRDLRIDPAGRIVVAGGIVEPLQTVAALYRLTPTGSLDPEFGAGGILREDFLAASSFGNTPLIDAAGRYLLLGRASGGGNVTVLAFARFIADSPKPAPVPASPGAKPTPLAPKPECAGKTATIVGTAGSDRLRGTKKADVIVALGGKDGIKGLGGADVICAGAGADTVFGGSGADRILGEGGMDHLFGGGGADRLLGGAGDDTLFGGAGADHEAGGPGHDKQG